ncbi:hypothetical protein L596_011725 [Steinernema carpocapsae]|uniref:Uncharacterized protein n=1 Tax=Steinernema carpocapsae TaxID=34508 RepID=A0A4U5NUX9_STECR|nr:hypothetical protein L596_011725 [Steinernema carpocapsae]
MALARRVARRANYTEALRGFLFSQPGFVNSLQSSFKSKTALEGEDNGLASVLGRHSEPGARNTWGADGAANWIRRLSLSHFAGILLFNRGV